MTKESEEWRKKLEDTYGGKGPKNNAHGKRPATRQDHGRAPVSPAEIARRIKASREKAEKEAEENS